MDKNECIQLLKELLAQIEHLSTASLVLSKAQEELNSCRAKPLAAVNSFDSQKKNAYIEEKAGLVPLKPKGAINYFIKKRAYEKDYAEYNERHNKAEKEYYIEFKDIRERIETEEKAKLAFEIHLAEEGVLKASKEYKDAATMLEENAVVSTKLKKATIVLTLIEYFQDQRVDSIKDAINLYYEEEHRKRLEEYAKEQVRLTAEAAEQARLAAISAREAADSAEEAMYRVDDAIYKVDDAMRKAEEAYDRANEAYDEAQTAYWAATSNNN